MLLYSTTGRYPHTLPPLQEDLGAQIDEEIRITSDLLQQAERELDVKNFLLQYNECVRRAFRSILPRLRRTQRNYDNMQAAEIEERWLQFRNQTGMQLGEGRREGW